MPCISANSVLVFIPPPVEPGDAPTNIRNIITSSPAFENSPSEYVEKPAVLAVTLLKRAPIHGISSVILKITAPPTVSPAAVEDPTGCGDAYRAGLLYGIDNGMDWDQTGRLASLMGAIKIASRGGQNHAPSRDDIAEAYRAAFGTTLW